MDKENIYELTLDDLQDQHREYAEVIGVDNLLRLSDNFGGTSIYIPQRRELEKNLASGEQSILFINRRGSLSASRSVRRAGFAAYSSPPRPSNSRGYTYSLSQKYLPYHPDAASMPSMGCPEANSLPFHFPRISAKFAGSSISKNCQPSFCAIRPLLII